ADDLLHRGGVRRRNRRRRGHCQQLPDRGRHPAAGRTEGQGGLRTASPPAIEWLSPAQAEFYDSVCRFARTLPDDVRARERSEEFSRDAWDRCAAFGIHGMPVPEDLGGGGQDVVSTMLGLEALGYGC